MSDELKDIKPGDMLPVGFRPRPIWYEEDEPMVTTDEYGRSRPLMSKWLRERLDKEHGDAA